MTTKPLTRSRQKRMVAGVLGGFADYFDWEPTWVRVAFVVISVVFAVAPCVLLYFLLWIVIPNAEPTSYQLSHRAEDWIDNGVNGAISKKDSHQQ